MTAPSIACCSNDSNNHQLGVDAACPACRTTDPGNCGLYLGRPCTFNDALLTRVSPVPRLNFTSIQSSSGLQGNCSFNPSNDVSHHVCHTVFVMLVPLLADVTLRWPHSLSSSIGKAFLCSKWDADHQHPSLTGLTAKQGLLFVLSHIRQGCLLC